MLHSETLPLFRSLFLLCCAFLTIPALNAQAALTGTLVDSLTHEPVAFATVYLDGTSTGDVSDDNGTFRIQLPTEHGPLKLVISHLNYTTLHLPVEQQSQPFQLVLSPKSAVLTQIELEGEDNRAANLKEFHSSFIGIDPWGRNAKMLNEEVLFFDRDRRREKARVYSKKIRRMTAERHLDDASWSPDSNSVQFSRVINLKATTNGALQVQLPDLGYLIHLDLQSFISDYLNRQMGYLGSSFFQEMPATNSRKAKRYAANRERAYWGSRMHFARSLVQDSLEENGFSVYEILREERFSGKKELAEIDLHEFLQPTDQGYFELRGLIDRKFEVLYFGDNKQRPIGPLGRRKGAVQSSLFMAAPAARIYPDGSLGDPNLVFSGDIGRRKLAWALPSNYQPPRP